MLVNFDYLKCCLFSRKIQLLQLFFQLHEHFNVVNLKKDVMETLKYFFFFLIIVKIVFLSILVLNYLCYNSINLSIDISIGSRR